MKKFRKNIKPVSVVLAVLTIAPLFLEVGENYKEVGLITIGVLGAFWASYKLYEEVVVNAGFACRTDNER